MPDDASPRDDSLPESPIPADADPQVQDDLAQAESQPQVSAISTDVSTSGTLPPATRQPMSKWVPGLAIATFLLIAGMFVAEPLVRWFGDSPHPRAFQIEEPAAVVIPQRIMQAITCFWFFMLGACFGSFLHCVEYRVPRKISIVARASSCPGCGTPIHVWHNVPVFGWLWLRGRCANCGWTIPPRYALTEFLFGFVFFILAVIEIVGAGMNLPGYINPPRIGMIENLWTPNWALIIIYAYHTTLLTFMLTWSLFAWDRLRIPGLMLAIAAVFGCIWPVVWPATHPVAAISSAAMSPQASVVLGLAAGGLMGILLGGAMVRRTPGNLRASDAASTIFCMALVGIYLGWQAALGVAILVVLMRLLALPTLVRRWPLAAFITLATLGHVLVWRWLVSLPWWPGPNASSWVAMGEFVLVVVASLWIDSVERGGDAGPPEFVLSTATPPPEMNTTSESPS